MKIIVDYVYMHMYNVIESKVTKQFIGGVDMELVKLRKYSEEAHGVDYVQTILEEAGDCVTNPEELEMYYYYYLADKIMAEYKYVLDRLTHSETERFHIGGKRR